MRQFHHHITFGVRESQVEAEKAQELRAKATNSPLPRSGAITCLAIDGSMAITGVLHRRID
jgi:hypothetical protein